MSIDETAHPVLHHLVVKGLADAPTVARCAGVDEDAATVILGSLVEAGLAVERTGRLQGFSPTAAGKEMHGGLIADDPLRRRRDDLGEWYGRFEQVNAELKEVCTAWQLADGPSGPVPNDHADAGYDAAVIGRLRAVHERVLALLGEAGDARLDRYAARLNDAMTAVDDGDTRRFTTPLADSYHDIWMELHHDLLVSFDRRRTSADA